MVGLLFLAAEDAEGQRTPPFLAHLCCSSTAHHSLCPGNPLDQGLLAPSLFYSAVASCASGEGSVRTEGESIRPHQLLESLVLRLCWVWGIQQQLCLLDGVRPEALIVTFRKLQSGCPPPREEGPSLLRAPSPLGFYYTPSTLLP